MKIYEELIELTTNSSLETIEEPPRPNRDGSETGVRTVTRPSGRRGNSHGA